MFELKGEDAETAKANAETVMRIETRLAKNSKNQYRNEGYSGVVQ